jgi:dolichyl-phosphate beta-glucosyltransferase
MQYFLRISPTTNLLPLKEPQNLKDLHCIIAIPCFRESKRLPLFLDSLCRELAETPFHISILIVDDGSGYPEDAALRSVVFDFQIKYPRLISDPIFLKHNLGKGGAVYAGWNSALKNGAPDLLCFVDADGAVPAYEVRRIVETLITDRARRWDGLFGSRVKMLGTIVSRRATRHYTGRIFATFVSVVTGIEIYDSQCGLKVIRSDAYAAIAEQLKEKRFAFDVELTLLLIKKGFKIREIPINWEEIPGSKVKILRDSIRMFSGVLRMRRSLGSLKAPVASENSPATR